MPRIRIAPFLHPVAATLLVAALALAGCEAAAPRPSARPDAPGPAMLPVPVTLDTPASAEARAYYAQVQQSLLSQGLLRTDTGATDAPFNDRILADNFIRIALYDEYSSAGGGLAIQREAASHLRRWETPVRVGLHFGASVPAEKRATDRARVGSYLARLALLTGHSIRLDDTNPNFQVYIVSENERRALGPILQAALPGLTAPEVAGVTGMDRSTYCLVYAQSVGGSSTYTRAFAVIRAEHPDLLRLSCIHEEIAQGLGLPNDSPTARPSIFNDDEEFALLTRQDELMLRILYNPALRPGMTEAEARAIVIYLASRMLGGES